jgi:hypothetical protein
MKQGPYWKGYGHPASQQIPHLLCNLKVRYYIHKIPELNVKSRKYYEEITYLMD